MVWIFSAHYKIYSLPSIHRDRFLQNVLILTKQFVLSGYELPWEDEKFVYPNNMAPPVEIAVEASNGASDYGNKFGEPVLAGFARSFGMMLPNGERREWVKPIMFSGGIGMIDGEGVSKLQPEKGEL